MRSNEIDQLAAALVAAQAEFEAVDKTANNDFFSSKYAPLPDVVKAATPILSKHGLAVTQLIVGDGATDGLMTMLLHSSGQFIESTMTLHLLPDKHGNITPQSQGSAVTYARRYAYMAVLGLVSDVDDDGNAASAPAPAQTALGAHRRSAPKAAVSTSTTPASATSQTNVASSDGRVGAADAKRELIAQGEEHGWDKEMATIHAKRAWGDRGTDPIERGELTLLLMAIEKP